MLTSPAVWRVSHGFNLVLKAFGNIDGIDNLIQGVKFVINSHPVNWSEEKPKNERKSYRSLSSKWSFLLKPEN